jgi:hypothetical protein
MAHVGTFVELVRAHISGFSFFVFRFSFFVFRFSFFVFRNKNENKKKNQKPENRYTLAFDFCSF